MVSFTNDEYFIYTRYLYNLAEVKQSLFLSLLEHDINESLFWAYEMHYSGHEDCLFTFINTLFNTIYISDNPELANYINTSNTEYKNTNNPEICGNIIATFCTRRYDLQSFCKTYFRCSGNQNYERTKNNMIVKLSQPTIQKYQTDETALHKYKILEKQCIYPVRKMYNDLFDITIPSFNDTYQIYNYHWLYYANHSPIWNNRINLYNGIADNDKKIIVFEDDDDLEEFYLKWQYDPDEQGWQVQSKSIGFNHDKQLSLKDFCNKHNFKIKFKIINKKLTNEFIHN
jgi:hypothetical protein|tara:strand:+ start:312 stop:1169 length:858 start_codon:yes stop_codon:yes gene_type:complete